MNDYQGTAMNNVEIFFNLADKDASIQKRLSDALAAYPGSLEVREAVAENVLLPVAEELGLPFSLDELRTFETEKKLRSMKADVPIEEGEPIEGEEEYWLLDRGWEWDETMLPEIHGKDRI